MPKKRAVKKKPETRGKGRPTRFNSEYIEQARKLSLLGQTDEEMADFFGVATSTFYKWKKDHKDFSEAIKSGKANADSIVVDSLYRKANGYTYREEASSKEGPVMLQKFAHPDTTAAIFWLKNRQPEKWRDKQEIQHSGEMTNKTVFEIVDKDGNPKPRKEE